MYDLQIKTIDGWCYQEDKQTIQLHARVSNSFELSTIAGWPIVWIDQLLVRYFPKVDVI